MSELKSILSNTEEFIKKVGTEGGEYVHEIREKSLETLRQVKEKADDFQDTALAGSKQVVLAADDYVHARPWKSISIATALGILVGLIINRK